VLDEKGLGQTSEIWPNPLLQIKEIGWDGPCGPSFFFLLRRLRKKLTTYKQQKEFILVRINRWKLKTQTSLREG
jgi:hypothetical protein